MRAQLRQWLDEMRTPFENGRAFDLASSRRKKVVIFCKTTGQPIINKEGRLCSILP
jgi:hypothetical protein